MRWDVSKERAKRMLIDLLLEFWQRYPTAVAEVSTTGNFILEGEGPSGPSYSVW